MTHPAYADTDKAYAWRREVHELIRAHFNNLAENASDGDIEWCYERGKTVEQTAEILIRIAIEGQDKI